MFKRSNAEFALHRTVGEIVRRRLKPVDLAQVVSGERSDGNDTTATSLYIHVPFCKQICSFCAFHRVVDQPEKRERYIQALERHIEKTVPLVCTGSRVDHIYIGGGTPSVLTLNQTARLLAGTRQQAETADARITFELHPKNITEDYVLGLLALGINRFSVGVQNLSEPERQLQHRTLTSTEEEIRTLQNLNHWGVRYNLDLMFGTVGQTRKSWEGTVTRVVEEIFPPEVTLYQYVNALGSETRLWISQGKVIRPGLAQRHGMYDFARDYLTKHGYHSTGTLSFSREQGAFKRRLLNNGVNFFGLGPRTYSKIGTSFLINNARIGDFVSPASDRTEDYYAMPVPKFVERVARNGFALVAQKENATGEGVAGRLQSWQAEAITQVYGVLYYLLNKPNLSGK